MIPVENLIVMSSTSQPPAYPQQPMVPHKTRVWVWILAAFGFLCVLGLITANIAVPNLRRAPLSAREIAAIQEIKTIHLAEKRYYSTFGKYADSLEALGPPSSGAAGPAAADLIPKSLAEGKIGGYVYTVTGTSAGYTVNAGPEKFGSSGRRTFFSDQTLIIRNNWSGEPANVNNPELGGNTATK
jgi:type IV pilus assembly protein PilA